MAIKEIGSILGRGTLSMDENEIESLCQYIKLHLGQTAVEYERAVNTYNTEYFKEESPVFKKLMCAMLCDHFATYNQNIFWINGTGK